MNDKHNALASGTATGLSFVSSLCAFLQPIRYIIIGLVLLIFIDLYFGLRESRRRKRPIRRSRAFRRTTNKILDYFCFILLAGFVQQLMSEAKIQYPLFSVVVIFVVGIFEIESIINHWLFLHDRKKVNFKRFLTIFAKNKSKVIGEISEEYENEQKRDKKE